METPPIFTFKIIVQGYYFMDLFMISG